MLRHCIGHVWKKKKKITKDQKHRYIHRYSSNISLSFFPFSTESLELRAMLKSFDINKAPETLDSVFLIIFNTLPVSASMSDSFVVVKLSMRHLGKTLEGNHFLKLFPIIFDNMPVILVVLYHLKETSVCHGKFLSHISDCKNIL